MHISDTIQYIGVNDRDLDLFEGQYPVENGMSYNSYVIMDEKIAVTDTVDGRFYTQWMTQLKSVLGDRQPDYLIVHHMEPDHSANIARFAAEFPDAKIAASAKAFSMMKQFFGDDFADRQVVLKEGDRLTLGQHTLTFLTAPMVHWPEVMVSYDDKDRILFSADGFGKFGALDTDEPWADEARRYYIGIVGKYGMQVQALLKKAAGLEIQKICPLHGPALSQNLAEYLRLYDTWSSYRPETEGVVIAYTSVYGGTKQAALQLEKMLKEKGVRTEVFDLARCDMFEAVAAAFRYSRLALATTTYNNDVFPYMHTFLHHLVSRGYQNRTVGLIENGTWAPTAAKVMRNSLEPCKNLTVLDPVVTVRSAMNAQSAAQLAELAAQLAK